MFRKGSKGRNPHSWSSVIKPPQAEGQLGQRGKRREAGREASSNNTVPHGAMTDCIDREGPGGEVCSMWKRPGTDALCHSPIPGTQLVMQAGWVLLGMPSLVWGKVRTCQGRGESEKALRERQHYPCPQNYWLFLVRSSNTKCHTYPSAAQPLRPGPVQL